MNIADYFDFMERWDKCKNECLKLKKMIPDYPFIRIKFARLLERGHYLDEAVDSYAHVFQLGYKADKE